MKQKKSSIINIHTVFICLIIIFFFFLDKTIAVWMSINLADTWLFGFSKFLGTIFVSSNVRWLAVLAALIACLYIIRNYRESAKPYAFIALNFFVCYFVAFILKFVLARYRPEMYFTENLYGFSFFSLKHACTSFPSGHTIAAFSIAIALFYITREVSLCYVVLILAIIIGISRVIITAHYCSDVLASIYLSLLITRYINSIYLRR